MDNLLRKRSRTVYQAQDQNNYLWDLATRYASTIDKCMVSVLSRMRFVDTVRLVLYVSWIWAWTGLIITKIFERIFIAILQMPDDWLAIPVGKIENTAGKSVHILSAHTSTGNITNKLKLFLSMYWEKGGLDASHNNNGVDFMSLSKMLNCSILYCSYLLTDKDGNIAPDVFWDNAHKFMVEQETSNSKTTYYRSSKPDASDRHKLPMRNLDFEGNASVN